MINSTAIIHHPQSKKRHNGFDGVPFHFLLPSLASIGVSSLIMDDFRNFATYRILG